MTIGSKIRTLREEKGLSQEELAQKMGYKSKTSIHKIEQDVTDLPLSKVNEFAKILGTTPAYLMGWDEPTSDSEFKEMMAFLNPYWVGVKYVENSELGEQYEIITYRDEDYGEIRNELFQKYLELKDLNEDDISDELSKFFSGRKRGNMWKQYDKEHKEEFERLSKEVEDIENSSPLVQRIKILLAIQGKNISDLEDIAKFERGTIEKWNRNLPITPKVQKVADILNTSLNYLISGEDENQENILFVARKAQDLNPKNLKLIKMTIDTLLENQGE